MKFCNRCKQFKTPEEFSCNRRKKDGLDIYCKPCAVKRCREYFLRKPQVQRAYKRQWISEQKEKVFLHYSGGKIGCVSCNYSDQRALSIDHINGDGAEHRREIKHENIYRWIVKNNFPSGFQVLCMNCQFIKGLENGEIGRRKDST